MASTEKNERVTLVLRLSEMLQFTEITCTVSEAR